MRVLLIKTLPATAGPDIGLGYLATALRRAGHQVAIADPELDEMLGEPRTVTQRVVDFDPDWFGVVIGSDDVADHKPHPAPVLAALAKLGRDASSAVMVGDSPHDLASGRAAGTRTAAVAWGPFDHAELRACAPDHWLESGAALTRLYDPTTSPSA